MKTIEPIIKTYIGSGGYYKTNHKSITEIVKWANDWCKKHRKSFQTTDEIEKVFKQAIKEKLVKADAYDLETLFGLVVHFLSSSKKYVRPPIKYPTLLFPVRIETRFRENELLIRMYPDDCVIDSHDDRITPNEYQVAYVYTEAKSTDPKEAWRVMVGKIGKPRATYLHQLVTSGGLENIDRRGQNTLPTPTIGIHPSHYLVYLYDEKGDLYDAKIGCPVKDNLPIISTFEKDDGSAKSIFDGDAKWIKDFDAAEQAGMAVKIPLKDPTKDKCFSRILVVGLNLSWSQDKSAVVLKKWIDNHRYSNDFAFIPYDTPTNNTGSPEGQSGFTNTDSDAGNSYKQPFVQSEQADNIQHFCSRIAKALGIPNECLKAVANAFQTVPEDRSLLQAMLWPSLGGHFLSHMVQGVPPLAREYLWYHFSEFVDTRGVLPSIRVGKQPYGILPVMSLTEFEPSDIDAIPFNSSRSISSFKTDFYQPFSAILRYLFGRWLRVANDSTAVPRIGQSDDPEEELTRILSMQPYSIRQTARKLVDDRLIRYLLEQSGVDVRSFVNQWTGMLNSPQSMLTEIVKAVHGNPEIFKKAPILKTFNWRDPFRKYDSISETVGGSDEELQGYLNDLSKLDDAAAPDMEKSDTLLYSLLARLLIYQHSCNRLDSLPQQKKPQGLDICFPYVVRCEIKAGTVKKINTNTTGKVKHLTLFMEIAGHNGKTQPVVAPKGCEGVEYLVKIRDQVKEGQPLAIVRINTDAYIRKSVNRLTDRKPPITREMIYPCVRDTLDLNTHRLDAWITSLANRRLEAMRNIDPSGIHIGAYGWVENLDRDVKIQSKAGGYIHAPSLAKAAAGAVLRNAYLTHSDNEDENPFCINLSSRRTRHGLRILQGIREGQELGALLGYRLERELHDTGMDRYIDLIRKCFPLDESEEPLPDGAAEVIQPRNVVNGLSLLKAWEADSDTVCDKIENKTENGILDQKVKDSISHLSDARDAVYDILMFEGMYQQVQGNYEHCKAALDAMAGEGSPPEIESVQSHMGGTALDHRVCLLLNPKSFSSPDEANIAIPMNPRDIIEPTLSSWLNTIFGPMANIGCMAKGVGLDINAASKEEWMKLEEIDEKIASAIIAERGNKGNYLSVAAVKERNTQFVTDDIFNLIRYRLYAEAPPEIPVSLANLNLGPMDFLRICGSMPQVGENRKDASATYATGTELEKRIKYYYRKENPKFSRFEVSIDFNRFSVNNNHNSEEKHPLCDAMELGGWIGSMLTSGTMLKPDSLSRPDESSNPDTNNRLTYDIDELKTRIESAEKFFDNLRKAELNNAQTAHTVCINLSKFGIAEVIPEHPEWTPDVALIKEICEKKNQDYLKLKKAADDTTDPTSKAKSYVDAAKALFGADLILLLQVKAMNGYGQTLKSADAAKVLPKTLDEERIFLWLQQAALTHPPLMHLENAMIVSETWENKLNKQAFGTFELKVLQLSEKKELFWQALSDDELDLNKNKRKLFLDEQQKEGRPRSVTSIVAFKDPNVKFEDQSFCGLMFDRWTEIIPDKSHTTGISFHFDRPNAQAPQAILLAVPSSYENPEKESWTFDALCDIVKDTIDLAKVRAVDLDALAKDSALGRFFPGMLLPGDLNRWDFVRPKAEAAPELLDGNIVRVTPAPGAG
ncbi:MAG: hypothetical protein ABIK15_09000 [Pseudomonadota bacterium]